jgi:bifunctional non-homologous end joining protein LigD
MSRRESHSRPGNDLIPLIVDALSRLRRQSCIIDGEAVACGDDGIANFERIRYRHNDDSVFLYAFDLIELNGDDLRRDPLDVRKATLANVLARAAPGLRLNEHIEEDGPVVFHHACKLGLEGIVSKRKDSRYSAGRSPHRIKSKNPNAPGGEAGNRGGVGPMVVRKGEIFEPVRGIGPTAVETCSSTATHVDAITAQPWMLIGWPIGAR